jgi:hypothetical protein
MAFNALNVVVFVLILIALSYLSYFVFARNKHVENFEVMDEEDNDDKGGVKTAERKKQHPRRGNSDKNEKEKDGGNSNQMNQKEREKRNYEMRIYVMKLFETLLKRSASDEEIDKYYVFETENEVLIAVMRDYKLGSESTVPATTKRTPTSANKTDVVNEGSNKKKLSSVSPPSRLTTKTNITAPVKAPLRAVNEDDEEAEAEAEVDADVVEDRNDSGEQFTAVKGFGNGVLHGKCFGKPIKKYEDRSGIPQNSVCLDKTDLLQRLKNVSLEVNQLYHMVSMY